MYELVTTKSFGQQDEHGLVPRSQWSAAEYNCDLKLRKQIANEDQPRCRHCGTQTDAAGYCSNCA